MKRSLRAWLDRREVSDSALALATATAVGLGTGLAAVAFKRLIQFVQWIGFARWQQTAGYPGWQLVLVPTVGGLLVGLLIYHFAREAKGHGVPEVMEAVALRGGRIRPVVVIVKALASSICIGSGGAAGREGPIVQIGSALGSTIGQALRLSDQRVINLVACGAAGGIAATFNAPIAGAIFAMEVILGRLNAVHFSAVVVSAVVADVVAQAFEGDTRAFIVPTYGLESPWELLLYALLGVVAAICSVGFTRSLYAMEDFWDGLRLPDYAKPAIGGFILGLVGLLTFHDGGGLPRIFGVGYETITDAAVGELALGVVVGLLFLKILATSLTLGSGGSGGIFAPSLFMGAMLGSSFGLLAGQFFPDVTGPSGGYALVGMSAFFAGASHAPVSAILLLFEMTGDYALILPLMLATVVSMLTARVLSPESIYTLKLTRRGVHIHEGRDAAVMEGVRVAEVMDPAAPTVLAEFDLAHLNAEFQRARGNTLAVIGARGQLVGIVSAQDLDRALAQGSIEGMVVRDVATLHDLLVAHPEESIGDALRRLRVRGLTILPVVEQANPGRLLGTVTVEDLRLAYERGVSRRSRQLQRAAEAGIADGPDLSLIYIDIPADAAADERTVADLDLPLDCLVVSVERAGQRTVVRGSTLLRAGDRVAVVVSTDNAAAIREALTRATTAC